MPIAKNSAPMACDCSKERGCCEHIKGFGGKIIFTLVGILLVYVIFYFGTIIGSNLKKYNLIGQADKMERSITISGYGKVTGNNDIAVTTLGYSNTNKDVAKAQADNKKVMDQVMMELKNMGVEDKDLQTNYSIYPDYDYSADKGSQLRGYKVTNQVTIKIRDLSKIPAVLGLAGKYGANEVDGLSFTIDDPENLKIQAKEKALADAKAKAQALAANLGIKLGGVVSYNEYAGSNDYYSVKSYMGAEGGGYGGGPATVAGGSNDIVMNVNITYAVKQ